METVAGFALRLRERDDSAHAEAFRRHAPEVALVAGRASSDRRAVDDAVQEVFLELWRRPERFEPDRGNLGTYLRTLVRARVIDRQRSDTARRRRESGVAWPDSPDVEGEVVAGLAAAQVRLALAALPPAERLAIELAFFGGRSYRQVAIELHEAEGTVKSRIRAGLRRLQVELARDNS
ncbi:MAG: sigma-70 family RNA polymerase sigma factor [Acidimicrobiales bacterium]